MVRFVIILLVLLASGVVGLMLAPIVSAFIPEPEKAPILVYGGAWLLGLVCLEAILMLFNMLFDRSKVEAKAGDKAVDPVQVQLAALTESVKALAAQVDAVAVQVNAASGLRVLEDFDPEVGHKLPELRLLLAELAAVPLPQIDADALQGAETALQALPRLRVLVDRYSLDELVELQQKLVHVNAIVKEADKLCCDREGDDYDYASLADQLEDVESDIARVIGSAISIKKVLEA